MFKPIIESKALSAGLSLDAINKNNIKLDHLLFRLYQGAGATPLTVADMELIKVRVTLNGDRFHSFDVVDCTLGELMSLTNLQEGVGQQSIAASHDCVADVLLGYYDLTLSKDELTVKIDCGAITAANTSPVLDVFYYRSNKNPNAMHYQYVSKPLALGSMPTEPKVLVAYSVNTAAIASADEFRITYSNGGTDVFKEKIAYAFTIANARVEADAFGLSCLFQDDDLAGTSISLETLTNAKRILYVKSA